MKSKLILCAVIALACGCASQQVPKSVITLKLPNIKANMELPKDSDITKFSGALSTNGTVTVTFDKLTTRMNPDVVGASGVATAGVIEATGNVAAKVGQSVAAGLVQGAKTP